jgi:predicted HicB family RNase H-like nuclease
MAMPARQDPKPPKVRLDTPIGPDVDLSKERVRLPSGQRLTPEKASAIVKRARTAGRPSLTGRRARSPQLSLRVSQDLLTQVRAHAKASGKTVSQAARGALEQMVKAGHGATAKSGSRRGPKV